MELPKLVWLWRVLHEDFEGRESRILRMKTLQVDYMFIGDCFVRKVDHLDHFKGDPNYYLVKSKTSISLKKKLHWID